MRASITLTGIVRPFEFGGLTTVYIAGGHKKMSSILADQKRPSFYEPKLGKGGCGVSADENRCAHHVTLSPNKLWRFNFIFNLCYIGSMIRYNKLKAWQVYKKSLTRGALKYLQWLKDSWDGFVQSK
jgi:hypothetical protein